MAVYRSRTAYRPPHTRRIVAGLAALALTVATAFGVMALSWISPAQVQAITGFGAGTPDEGALGLAPSSGPPPEATPEPSTLTLKPSPVSAHQPWIFTDEYWDSISGGTRSHTPQHQPQPIPAPSKTGTYRPWTPPASPVTPPSSPHTTTTPPATTPTDSPPASPTAPEPTVVTPTDEPTTPADDPPSVPPLSQDPLLG